MSGEMKEKPDVVTLAGLVEWRTTKTIDEMVMWLADELDLTEDQQQKLPEALSEMFASG